MIRKIVAAALFASVSTVAFADGGFCREFPEAKICKRGGSKLQADGGFCRQFPEAKVCQRGGAKLQADGGFCKLVPTAPVCK